MVFLFTPRTALQWRIAPFIVLGVVVSEILLEAMLVGSPTSRLGTYRLAYTIGLRHGVVIIALHVVVTCGPMIWRGCYYRQVSLMGAVI
jgi:hypothetical protein